MGRTSRSWNNVEDCGMQISMTESTTVNMVSAVLAKKWEQRDHRSSAESEYSNSYFRKKYLGLLPSCQSRC